MHHDHRFALALVAGLLSFSVTACSPTIPDGRFACAVADDCPPNFECRQSLCYGSDSSPDQGTVCGSNAECANTTFCDGEELCAPEDPDADAMGCVPGNPACLTGFVCAEADQSCTIDCATPDPDGDGQDSAACGGDDCDDTDSDRFLGNPETCFDQDGGSHDEDCDPATFGDQDQDGDGEVSNMCCNGITCGTDCDDENPARRSEQVEFCDSVDNDCDNTTDEETQAVAWYVDGDGDGFGNAIGPMQSCAPIAGRSLFSTDCDDTDSERNPAQIEICDLAENNCNGMTDEQPYCDVIVVVNNTGGTLMTTASMGGAVNVTVPAGALSAPVALSIGEYHPRSLPALAAGQQFIGLPVALTPFGTTFSMPVTITLPAVGSDLVVLMLSGPDADHWQPVSANISGGVATFTVTSGGIFGVATRACADGAWDHDGTTATACLLWSDCPAGQYVTGPGTETSNRQCAACAAATYTGVANQQSCTAWTNCAAGTFASTPGSPSVNRVCTGCSTGTFSASMNAATCATWTVCSSGTVEGAAGSATEDRECLPLAWTRQFGGSNLEHGYAVAANAAGDVYVGGSAQQSLSGQMYSGGTDGYIRRYTRLGAVSWTRMFGNVSAINEVLSLAFSGSNVYGVGRYLQQARVVVYNESGLEQLASNFLVDQETTGMAVAVGPGGIIAVGGASYGTGTIGGQDAFVRLLTSGGITSWTREITTADVSEGSEEVRALAFDSSGDVYAAGIVADAFVGFTDLGGHDIFVMKLNGATGVPIWTQQFGSAGEDLVGAIRLSADGSALYIAGSVDGALPGQTNAGDRDAYVRAMSTSTGAVSWTHQFGTTSTDEGRGLTLGPSGDVFVTGWTNNPLVAGMWFGGGDGFIRRLNSSGSPQWTYQFGTSSRDEAYAIIYAGDGYLCVAGMTQGEFPGQVAGGGLDAFVARVLPE